MKSVGIFAGTFDPVHEGHLVFARAALERGLEKVMFLPEPRPRRKQGVHAYEHRLAMVQLAVADEPRFGVIQLEQAKFTPLETLPVLKQRFSGYELTLMFGDDVIAHMVDHIADWPHIESLAQSASLLIAARNQTQGILTERLETLKTDHDLPFRYEFVQPGSQVSSSGVRAAIKSLRDFSHVPPAAAAYIRQHKLYSLDEIIS